MIPKIINYDDLMSDKDSKKHILKNNPLLGLENPCRVAIIGASNTGKSNILTFMLDFMLDYSHLYIIAPTIDQDKYDKIARSSESRNIVITNSMDDINIDDFDGKKNGATYAVIFDDMIHEGKNDEIGKFFSFGRHKSISVFILSQRFHGIPLIARLNCSAYIVFRLGSARQIQLLRDDICADDLTKEEFKKIYNSCCKKHDFLYINKTKENKEDIYKKNLFEPVF